MKRPKLNLVQPDLIEVEPGKAKPRITEDERLIIETDLPSLPPPILKDAFPANDGRAFLTSSP